MKILLGTNDNPLYLGDKYLMMKPHKSIFGHICNQNIQGPVLCEVVN